MTQNPYRMTFGACVLHPEILGIITKYNRKKLRVHTRSLFVNSDRKRSLKCAYMYLKAFGPTRTLLNSSHLFNLNAPSFFRVVFFYSC